jgi:putative tryptophan/tyrosine transport system substrate-binding protein
VISRRAFIAAATAMLASARTSGAEQAGKAKRIGLLGDTSPPAESRGSGDAAFRDALRELGYVEGRNVTLEYRYAEGKREALPVLAADLVRSRVDVIVALGPAAARAAKGATTTIPVVFVGSGDPIAEGLVASLARPGGNLTGLTIIAGMDIVGKRLELLKEIVPGVTLVAMLWNPTNPSHVAALKEVPGFARSLRVEIKPIAARGPEDFEGAFVAMRKSRVGGLLVLADGLYVLHAERLTSLSLAGRLPTVYGNESLVKAGGLMAYQAGFIPLFRRSATLVDKILKGTKPGDIPVEQLTQVELTINLKTAKALGLTMPPSLLLRANEVIQ